MAKKHRKDRPLPAAAQPAAAPPRFPAWVVWPAFSLWGFFVLKSYLARFAPNMDALANMLAPGQYAGSLLSVLPGHLLNLLAAAFFLFACWSLGRLLLGAAGFAFRGALEESAFSLGAGLGGLSVFVLLLSVFKALYLWPVAAFLLLSAAGGAWSLYAKPAAPVEGGPKELEWPDLAVLVVLLAAFLVNLAGALGPEIFYDALVYHLAVPNYYVIKHGFEPMPFNFYSNLPMTHGMLYAAALLVKGEALAKLLNYSTGLAAAAALVALGARHFSLRAGLWGAAIAYTVGHAMFASWSAGTEAPLTFFSVLALYAVLNRSEEQPRWLWLAACFCGLAMGVKYTGFFTGVGAALVYAWSDRARPAAVLKNLVLFGLLASFFVGPWLLKNWHYTGNPVFPFAAKVFGTGPHADPQKLSDFLVAAAQKGPLRFPDWFVVNWNATMGRIPNSEYFTPLFLLLLPLAFLLHGPASAAAAGAWTFFLVAWLGWTLSSTMVRFLMPAYPAAGLLIGYYLFSPGHRWLKAALKAAVAFCCACGLYWGALVLYSQGRWRPAVGQVPAEEYLSHTQPSYPYSGYSGLKFFNEKTPPGSKLLLIGDERSYYLKKDFIVSSVYDRAAIVEYALAAADGPALYARLKAEGVTHLLVNTAEAIRLGRDYRMFYWDARARRAFSDFWAAHALPVFSFDETQGGRLVNRIEVYELFDRLPPGAKPAFNPVEEVIMKNLPAGR